MNTMASLKSNSADWFSESAGAEHGESSGQSSSILTTFKAARSLTKDSKRLDRKEEMGQHVDGWGAEDPPPHFMENPRLRQNQRTKEGRRLRPQGQDGDDFPEIPPPDMQNKCFLQVFSLNEIYCNVLRNTLYCNQRQFRPADKRRNFKLFMMD